MLTRSRPTVESHGILRVLVIDRTIEDMRAIRDLLQTEARFRINGARSLDEAANLLESADYDVAVVDYDLWSAPDQALITAVRRHHPDLAVVLLTNNDNERDAINALKIGANDFLNRAHVEDGTPLATRILAAVEESRAMRRRDTMVRWLEREARTDHLTGLSNRRAFDEQLHDVCDAARYHHAPVSLIIIDVTGTRMVNEAYGHEVGDGMIRRAAASVARSIRGADFAARVGGDDFGVILPESDIDVARRVARRIAHEIERMNTDEYVNDVPVTVTFGVASGVGCDAAALLSAADQQLSAHKGVRPSPTPFHTRVHEDGPSVA
jgi:two-component system cell cycle response regulator